MNLTPPNSPETLLAAVDLGSNSFRLEVARFIHGQIQRVDYIKEPVRQGGDLDEDRNLTADAIDRGLKCLARFGEVLKGFPSHRVRAVATQTLREAKNREEFLKLAKKALGYEVEIISGVEEARLIYQGVSRLLPQSNEKRLVIDIGGRSTEFIIGKHFNAETTDSLRVGSVAWSLKYFPDGQLSEKNFERAEIAAESVLDMIADTYHSKHWDVAYGASGTVGAVADILTTAGFGENIITNEGLVWLKQQLIKAKSVDKLDINGLREDRKAVISGGLSILLAVFDILKLDKLTVARGALRHGLIYDMTADDDVTEDLREASINYLTEKFRVNKTQANNVSKVATSFFDTLSHTLQFEDEETHELTKLRKILGWAAYSHEIGCAISHSDSRRHGAYILDNTELMGFAQSELHRLSLLVLGHYGKIRKLDADFNDEAFVCQLLSIRLAVIFCHSRNTPVLKNISLSREGKTFHLSLSSAWQQAFPQTRYLLEEEVLAWQKSNWGISINTID